MSMERQPEMPFISVIVPVRNGGAAFRHCLEALQQSTYPHWEAIVVDDGSQDGSAEFAQQQGFRVISTARPGSGPAVARNTGAAAAQGDILFFIDADVLVRPESIGRVATHFITYPSIVACFGSYDDEPAAPNFLSQYKNLQHHFVHQTGRTEASTFWSGCGAIRRDVFLEMGGFTEQYGRPSIEDIELGYRLRAAGHRIRLDKALQVKHLKTWTVSSLLRTDIRDRAIPWSDLILRSQALIDDLNVQRSQRLSTALAFTGVGAALASTIWRAFRPVAATAFSLLTLLNWPFYYFLARKRGFGFALLAWPWHVLYYLYSGLAFVYSLLRLQTKRAPALASNLVNWR